MELSFKKRNWNRLLSEIEDHKIIPVIGPELLVMELDGRQILFYDYLAQQLAERLEIDEDDLPEDFVLNDVAMAFIADNGDPADIYFEIREIMTSREWPVPAPLLCLAKIQHFTLFLSTTFDPFMKQALDAVRFGGNEKTKNLAYSNRGKVVDLPPDIQSQCIVFQLFGKVSAAPDYAVTDDDLLLFNHSLQSQDHQPLNLFDRLKSNYLLTMGCNFPDWFARFFFCATKGDILFSDMGMRGVLVDKQSMDNKHLNNFLKRRKTLLYQQGNASEFVAELYSRWTEKHGTINAHTPIEETVKKEADPFLPESIFLSYASEDRIVALKIKESLESVGVDVWFDQNRLEAGDKYETKILKNITKSSFFFPIISQNTITEERRFFRLEWHEAIKESRFRSVDTPFIQPIVIDDVQYDNPNIPMEFNQYHWQRFPDGTLSEDFLALTRQRIRKLRRNKRNQV